MELKRSRYFTFIDWILKRYKMSAAGLHTVPFAVVFAHSVNHVLFLGRCAIMGHLLTVNHLV